MTELLNKELETYSNNRERLIGQAKGKFVLIHDDEVLGVFDTHQDAVRQGYDQLGNVPFLVKQVLEVEIIHNFVSNLLAV